MGSCDSYKISRRRFLMASGGAAMMMGLPVRDLMALTEAGKDRRKADHVILLWMAGGMSHIDTFDPKPGRKTAGEFAPIKTTADGVEISEILPTIATQMKHASLVRSIAGREGAHDRAAYHLLTSYRPAPQLVHPSLGSIASHELDPIGVLPSFVSVGGRAMPAGYLGQRCEAYFIGRAGQPDPYLTVPNGINEARADRRLELLNQLNGNFVAKGPDSRFGDIDQTYSAAIEFMNSPSLSAFDLDQETEETKARYGDSDFGRGCLLARRLVEHDVRFVQVNLGGFDTHDNNFGRLGQLAEIFDPAVGSLMSDLAASGRLDRTVVLMLSEFGRTPNINDGAGRDHHPGVFSAMLAGGGLKKGEVIGSSDADGYKPDKRPVQVADIHATVCAALGVDPDHHVNTPIGRPMKLVDNGAPIRELL